MAPIGTEQACPPLAFESGYSGVVPAVSATWGGGLFLGLNSTRDSAAGACAVRLFRSRYPDRPVIPVIERRAPGWRTFRPPCGLRWGLMARSPSSQSQSLGPTCATVATGGH